MQLKFTFLFSAWLIILGGTLWAQDEQTFRTRQAFGAAKRVHKRIAPDSFKLDPLLGKDLKIEVWATSPLLFSPIAMDMDEQGRMWLTEGLDFSHNPYQQLRVAGGQSIIVVTDRRLLDNNLLQIPRQLVEPRLAGKPVDADDGLLGL